MSNNKCMISSVACCECQGMDVKQRLLQLLLLMPLVLVQIAEGQDLCGFSYCGTLFEEHYIKFNHITDLEEYPWIGRVGYESDRGIVYNCLAVLISRQHLLAPAFCFHAALMEKTPARHVLLGDWDPRNPYMEADCDFEDYCNPKPQLLEIEEIIMHPNYSHVLKTDNIAILKLVQPLKFTGHIRPICLQPESDVKANYIAQYLPITGFSVNTTISYKLKGLVQISGHEHCHQKISEYSLFISPVPKNYVCGIGNLSPSLMLGSALMGVHVHNGEPKSYYLLGLLVNQHKDLTQIFMTIQPYREWIERNLMCTTML